MNPGAQDRAAGFDVLLAFEGEDATFRGAALRCVIDRTGLGARQKDVGQVNFESADQSYIELLTSACTPPPKVGEQILDGFGQYHRIKEAQRTEGFTFKYKCKVQDSE